MASSFVPGPDTLRAYRDVLGCFGSGVTIITVAAPDGPMAMTANSFSSVSLDPPLVLWSVAKSSRRYQPFFDALHFAIHVLDDTQKDVALHFAANGNGFDRFDWAHNDDGVPVLQDRLALFECRTFGRHHAGDHTIIVGQVLRADRRDGAGLAFDQRQYGRFQPFDAD